MSIARFYKADLQMQTPVDRLHWSGPERLLPGASASERATVAEAYIRRCYEVDLEIIGITGHNIAPPDCSSLIPELEAAIENLQSEYGYRIALFPGFEVSVTIGRGVHIVCLFEPGTAVSTLSDKLTQLGLPPTGRYTDGRPNPTPASAELTLEKLTRIIQDDTQVPAIIVLAHATGHRGAMDRETIEQWWSMDVIKDERILCVELPHPRETYLSSETQSLTRSILENSDSRYERRHPIASICSSDCKSLTPSEGDRNYIGKRHTWIKLGNPSIEGLRQAFLDHESRIRFGDVDPNTVLTYPKILSANAKGATFLADQEIRFGPNLNVIIGGSGTGKSTLVNYMRMSLGQDGQISGREVRDEYNRSLTTVKSSTTVTVIAELEGKQIHVSSSGRGKGTIDPTTTPEMSDLDIATVFPVRFYGQREIYSIADDRKAALTLVDDLIDSDLQRLARHAEDLSHRHNAAAESARELDNLQGQLRQVESQRARVQTTIDRLREVAEPLERLSAAADGLEAVRLMETAGEDVTPEIVRLGQELVDRVRAVPTYYDERVTAVKERYEAAAVGFLANLKRCATSYRELIGEIPDDQRLGQLRAERDAAKAEASALEAKLAQQGIAIGSFGEQRAELQRLDAEASDLAGRIAVAEAAASERDSLLQQLVETWTREIDLREQSATRLNSAVPSVVGGQPFVNVTVHPYGDDQAFRTLMQTYRGDRRRLSDDDWNDLLQAVFNASRTRPPNHVMLDWLRDIDAGRWPASFPSRDARVRERVLACFPEAARDEIAAMRVPDRVSIVLRRQDGSVAGDLETGLSVGQKCTAILALLLALDRSPVVIDQPEDEIDNEFTYREMVPLLRKVKEHRQVVIVTHDPNIPVNGDAEMIYALSAVDGRGQVKVVDSRQAVGSLDHPHVRLAVEEIMEGSEEAFRRRFVKYGF